jgi:hypothetical protein
MIYNLLTPSNRSSSLRPTDTPLFLSPFRPLLLNRSLNITGFHRYAFLGFVSHMETFSEWSHLLGAPYRLKYVSNPVGLPTLHTSHCPHLRPHLQPIRTSPPSTFKRMKQNYAHDPPFFCIWSIAARQPSTHPTLLERNLHGHAGRRMR